MILQYYTFYILLFITTVILLCTVKYFSFFYARIDKLNINSRGIGFVVIMHLRSGSMFYFPRQMQSAAGIGLYK